MLLPVSALTVKMLSLLQKGKFLQKEMMSARTSPWRRRCTLSNRHVYIRLNKQARVDGRPAVTGGVVCERLMRKCLVFLGDTGTSRHDECI